MDMNPTAFNTENQLVPALVVSTDDPEHRGRVKCQRLDEAEIPVDKLAWTFIHGQSHASNVWGAKGESIGESPHSLIAGTWIYASKRASDNQTSQSHGVIATTTNEAGSGQS